MPPRVTVKKNLIIFHKPGDWSDIYAKILEEFGIGMALRTRLRRELGFSYRHYQEWITFDRSGDRERKYCEEQIRLDFYDEQAQSWFQLKYLNL